MRAHELVNEAPLPDDWDHAIFDPRVPFKRRVEYAQERAKRLGAGSSRIAFVIPYQGRQTVLKVAKNRKGMAQNEVEASYFGDHYFDLFIPMIDYDETSDTPTWIHTELASKITPAQFKQAFGADIRQVTNYVRSVLVSKLSPQLYSDVNPENEMVAEFLDVIGSSDLDVDDLDRLSNWGMYQGKPVIIDAGFDKSVASMYYG